VNRPFGVPALAGPDLPAPGLRQAGRLKAGLQTRAVPTDRFLVRMHCAKRMEPFHELMGAAGILPAVLSSGWSAGKMPAAFWRCLRKP